MSELPPGWAKKMSKTHGKEYYYNAEVKWIRVVFSFGFWWFRINDAK